MPYAPTRSHAVRLLLALPSGVCRLGWRNRCAAAWLSLLLSFGISTVWAGGGPENVLLVVNQNSDSSKEIANHYIKLRRIPAINVLHLDWQRGVEQCSMQDYRKEILTPILQAIEIRKLALQIDYVVFSSDFPWRVNLRSSFPERKFPRTYSPVASLTGATYLWQLVAAESPLIASNRTNWYAAIRVNANLSQCKVIGNTPSRAFRYFYAWDRNGKRLAAGGSGRRYFLSTMLGVTSGRGNSVDEVRAYLSRAVQADGSKPRGTIYLMKRSGIRSATRHACFAEVKTQIQRRDVAAEILPGALPSGKRDIMGITTGVATFDFARSGCNVLPGAICEHLTSFGGDMRQAAGQTSLAEFLRQGAAGASGTVVEPYAQQAKFPLPSLHLHYVRGASLAEAFYSTVAAPYQLLIVGDPLCQPWAVAPSVRLHQLQGGEEVQGTIQISPLGEGASGRRIAFFELYIDGRLQSRVKPANPIEIDTTTLADGFHEIRIVGVEAGALETQGRIILPVQVVNEKPNIEFSVEPRVGLAAATEFKVTASQPGATALNVVCQSRLLEQIEGESGTFRLQASRVGRGSVMLECVSEGANPQRAMPVFIEVE